MHPSCLTRLPSDMLSMNMTLPSVGAVIVCSLPMAGSIFPLVFMISLKLPGVTIELFMPASMAFSLLIIISSGECAPSSSLWAAPSVCMSSSECISVCMSCFELLHAAMIVVNSNNPA